MSKWGRTLSTCGENCRLCSVQCHCKVKPVAPSCTKLRTTWGKLQHNFRNILSCADQSQGWKLIIDRQTDTQSIRRNGSALKAEPFENITICLQLMCLVQLCTMLVMTPVDLSGTSLVKVKVMAKGLRWMRMSSSRLWSG